MPPRHDLSKSSTSQHASTSTMQQQQQSNEKKLAELEDEESVKIDRKAYKRQVEKHLKVLKKIRRDQWEQEGYEKDQLWPILLEWLNKIFQIGVERRKRDQLGLLLNDLQFLDRAFRVGAGDYTDRWTEHGGTISTTRGEVMYPYVGEQITSAIRRDLILVELCHEKTEGKEDAGWKDSLVDEIRDAGNDHWPDGARLDSRDMKELVGGEPWYPADFKAALPQLKKLLKKQSRA